HIHLVACVRLFLRCLPPVCQSVVARQRHHLHLTLSASYSLYPLSLHDALPISTRSSTRWATRSLCSTVSNDTSPTSSSSTYACRSEEHTSELQSRFDLVCRLLLDKKK